MRGKRVGNLGMRRWGGLIRILLLEYVLMSNEGYGMISICADWALIRCESQQEIDLIGATFRGERE